MITITRAKCNLQPSRTIRAFSEILPNYDLEQQGDYWLFQTETQLSENDRQALEKIIRGLGEWYGEFEYQESVTLV